MKHTLVSVALALVAVFVGPAIVQSDTRTVPYCNGLNMQIHGEQDGTQAAVLYVHGGGWESGDNTTGFEWRMIAPLVDAGLVVTTIDYRLAPAHEHPAQIEDVTCAIRFMQSNAANLGIDAGRIGIMGDSAGGHLAALAGLASAEFGGGDVQAVATFYGVFDLVNLEPSLATGAVRQNFPTATARANGSPILYVDGGAPPFLIAHGTQDIFVDVAQSVKLAIFLDEAGHDPLLVAVENAGHGFVPRGGVPVPPMIDIITLTVAFFDAHL